MSLHTSFKSALAEGRKALGCWLFMTDPMSAEIIGYVGFDCVVIDQEHGPGTPATAIGQLQAMAAAGNTPALIRVAWNDAVLIKRALDTGADGIMVPMVEHAEQAERVVAACRYPPRGICGRATPVVRASDYGLSEAHYLETVERQLTIICQIETRAGLGQIEAIAAVEGIDMVFIGPTDLATGLGIEDPRTDTYFAAIMADAETRILATGMAMGTTPYAGLDARALFTRGHALVLGPSDIALLRDAARDQVTTHRPRE